MNRSRISLRRCRPALGTYVEIGIATGGLPKQVHAGQALEQAFAAVAQVDRLMSFHRPDSELSRINAAAAGSVLVVHPWTAELLRLARELHGATGGLFDCGVGDTLRDWGVLPRHEHSSHRSGTAHGVGRTDRHGSVMDVEPDELSARIRILRPVCLDLGGIAKGFAVDRAIDALAAAGIRSAVVNAGGDLRVLGPQPHRLHVRWPNAPSSLVYLGELADGAAATTAPYYAAPDDDVPARWPVVHPLTRQAAASRRSFTVLAPLCAVADGLTKALALAGDLAEPCLRQFAACAVVL